VRHGQVGDVDVVADARAVGRVVVVAVDAGDAARRERVEDEGERLCGLASQRSGAPEPTTLK
jgi:hypothetical protein